MINTRRARTLLAILAVLLPKQLRRWVHVRLLGYEIDPTAVVGRSLIDVDACRLGPRALVGHLNVVRGCERFEMGEEAVLDSLNWVNAVRRSRSEYFKHSDRDPSLVLEKMARIQNMHFVDCTDLVYLEERASLSGVWTMILTHSFDHREGRLRTASVRLGLRTAVSSRSCLLAGATVPEKSIVAAGSVIPGILEGSSQLFGGVPAKALRPLDPNSKFFTREVNTLY